jgi:hypothetical protein
MVLSAMSTSDWDRTLQLLVQIEEREVSANVIQFSSAGEIEACFQADIKGLFKGSARYNTVKRVILAPSSLLERDDENALQHILDLTSEYEFDFEFGEGDREAGEDADQDWVECKIEEIENDCNDFEKRLLGAVLRPGEQIPAAA